MPFDFKKFDAKCATLSPEELQREWEHYTRLISGSATSTAVSGAAIPFTLGVSVIGVGLAAPAIHNARKKREIIERHLQRHGTTHHTRKRDVLTPMAISGTVGLVTLGVGSAGADAVTNAAAEHGFSSIAANEIAVKAGVHLAVDGVAMAGEEHHMKQKRLAEAHNAWLRQQAAIQQAEKLQASGAAPFAVPPYDQKSQLPYDTKITDMKQSDSLAWGSSMPCGSPLPPYSPPLKDNSHYYSPLPQQYAEKPMYYDASAFPPPPPPVTNVVQVLEKTEPQRTSVIESTKVQYYEVPSPQSASIHLHVECSQPASPSSNAPEVYIPPQITQGHLTPLPSVSGSFDPRDVQNAYPQQAVQQVPQPMYPSYPATAIPASSQPQNLALDEEMQRLSISSPQATGSSVFSAPQVQTPAPSAPLPHSTTTGHEHPSEQSTSYFPPPPPSPAVSAVSSARYTRTPSIVSSSDYFASPPLPSRYSSVSSYSGPSMQSQWEDQKPAAPANQYNYPSPAPTPSYFSNPAQSQRQGSIPSQYQPPPCPMPQNSYDPKYSSYAYGLPTPAQTPAFSTPPPPPPPPPQTHNDNNNLVIAQPTNDPYQHRPQLRHSASSSYFPPPPPENLAKYHGQYQPSQPYPSPQQQQQQQRQGSYPGYPTPAATPAEKMGGSSAGGGMYFPPPPTQPFVTGAFGALRAR